MMETVAISSRCPQCNDSRVVRFLRVELTELLTSGREIGCWCASCDEKWALNQTERAAVQRDIDSK
jgi:hypothetical protein